MSARTPAISFDQFTTFGDLLKFLRRRAGLTQRELSIAVGYSDAQISRLEQNQRLPDLATITARFVPALDAEDEPAAVKRLMELAAAVRREDAPLPGLPPFKGLHYFDEADAELFFGREALTAKLVARLTPQPPLLTRTSASGEGAPKVEDPAGGGAGVRFLAVIGASGSGKSSLVRAGVAPALRWNPHSASWPVHTLTPTAHPLESLAQALDRDSSFASNALRDPRCLHLALKQETQRVGALHVMLVVDQFEELFALCREEAERLAFINNLLTAAFVPDGPAIVTLTLRADFYAHCAPYDNLREALTQHQEYIGPMTSDELRRAIEEPAKQGGWELEPGLVDLLLNDVGEEPGALPLLSHALLETWQRRQGRRLTLSGYTSSGGVRGAIAETAETVFKDQLSAEQREIARRIFLRLTELGENATVSDTRRRAGYDELIHKSEDAAAVREVLKALADARLIITEENAAEVAHEALIREWPTLRGWLEENRDALRLHRRLTEAAQTWGEFGRQPSELYREARLAQALEWAAANPGELNALEREFLAASQAHAEREAAEREAQRQRELEAARRLAETEGARADSERQRAEEQVRYVSRVRLRNRVIAGAGAVALALAVLAGIFGLQSNQNATRAETNFGVAQANFTRAEAQRLAAEANKLLLEQTNADVTALLSIRSMNTQYSPQGDAALTGAMTLPFPRLVFTGHTGWVWDAAFSPDGKYVLTGSADKTARLWDARTGKEVRQFLGHTDPIWGVAYSSDGRYVATASEDKTARLWDAETGEEVRVFTHAVPVYAPAFSPDGQYLVIGGAHTPWLWDTQTGQIVREFTYSARTFDLALSSDGKYILTGGKDNVAHLWDAQNGTEIAQFTSPTGVKKLAFSPDSQRILTADEDKIIRLWDVHTGQILRSFVGNTFQIWSVRFSPDGKYVLSGGGDGTARLWDAETGAELRILTGVGEAHRAVFSPDGKQIFIAGNDGTGRLWDTENVIRPGLPQFISQNDMVWGAAFSPDGKYVATGNTTQKMVKLWDARTGVEIREFIGHADYVWSLTFSPDGKYLLTGGGNADNTARLWDVQTGQELRRFAANEDKDGVQVAFSPDGRHIATFNINGRLWDVQTGQAIRTFVGHSGVVSSVAFSPDGRYLLTGGTISFNNLFDATARLWDVQTGKQLHILNHPSNDEVGAVAFSPDSKYALTGDGYGLIRLWDVETGTELREYAGHTKGIYGVTFSPDGKYALSASDDGTARLWDIATGIELRRFTGHTAALWSAVFSPDSKYVLTGSNDGTARIWFTDYHDAIQYLCSHLPRDFTDDERKQYNITDNEPTCPKP